ncbi:MAG TPA: hypothetical protein PLM07_03905 [Candidatus Rifleibacterium sp.]|nr:hypothetical protein [Candidatus Rifleibacterium sp.]
MIKIAIQAGTSTYLIASKSIGVDGLGVFQGRLLNEVVLARRFSKAGNTPVTLNVSIRNNDGFIPRNVNLWAAAVVVTTNDDYHWLGKITAYDRDEAGILRLVITEKTAPELTIQFPDEVARLVTVDENFHVSALNVTLPLVVGGNTEKPILVKGILIDKTRGIYLLCVGENHQVVNVYRGIEKLTTGYAAYTGTAGQTEYAGFAYVELTDSALRKTDEGNYVEISAEVIGLKLGSHTVEECRNGARFLQYLLTTARDGICGWGLGVGSSEIDATAFSAAIASVDAAGLKMDGVFYFRQLAQSWIDQICQAIRGSYEIGDNGQRRLFVNADAASVKTYTKKNIKLLRDGKGAYTGQVYNRGRLDFDYNPLTGQFMQHVEYEDDISAAAIGELDFSGQSYLIRDMATAQAIIEYTCKRSLLGADKVYFRTRELPMNARIGTVITIDYPEKGLTGTWQITSLDIGSYTHEIEAEKFSSSIFVVGAPGTAIDWSGDAPIVSPVLPGAASGLTLSTEVEYDASGDGSAIPYISGTFTIPEGKYLGAAVFWGEGAAPSSWNSVTIKGTEFKIKPVRAGVQYTVKVQMFNQSGSAAAITGSIVAGKHETLPPMPTITVQSGLGCVIIDISVAAFSALASFEIQRRKSDGSSLTIVAINHRSTRFVDDSPEILQNYAQNYQYQARSMSNSRKYSAWSAWSNNVQPIQIQSKDITDLPIISKTFMTAAGVGTSVDGVKFSPAGIEMWQAGIKKVSIPVSGSPDFKGTITALSGYIGECVIADGGLRSVDFVSGNRGWRVTKTGEAEFNNLRARGAIETVVFKKDEISVIGGRQMVRPATVVDNYDYDAYLAEVVTDRLGGYWQQLDSLLDVVEAPPAFPCADYDDFYDTELGYWMQISGILETGVFATAITQGGFTCLAQQSQFAAYWVTLNSLLDQSMATPTFACTNFAGYESVEFGGWMQLNEFLDLDIFEPAIGADDIRLHVESVSDFALGDVVRIKDGAGDYWAVVDFIGTDYIDVSHRAGSKFGITPGQAVANYGRAGSGGIMLDGQAPLIDLFSHNGEPWNGTDLLVRQGNLKGWGGITDDVYGIAMGSPGGDYFLAIPGQGIILNGKIQITGGSGIGNFADSGALASRDNIDLSYVTDAGALAGADNLDGVPDGSTYKRVTSNEKAGAGRAYSGLDANNRLITAVIPGTAVSPSGAGLYLGSNRMGFYNSGWKTYMDNLGNFALIGGGAHGLSWNAETGVLTISGSVTILGGSGYGSLTDKPTSLASINSTEGGKLAGIAAGADVTANNTAYDTARVAGVAAATVKDNAANAISQLNDISADNKLVPLEKHSVRKEWDIIAAEKAGINSQATTFGVTTENTTYNNAFQALATYLNAGTTWSSGVPSWLSDANLGTTTTIVGATFRANWKDYYDARTALLNAISAKAKTLANTAQNTADNAASAAATAQTTANNAATAATNAQNSATTANNLLADIAADNKLTPLEKQDTRQEWDIIAAEKAGINAQAAAFSITTENTTYNNAFQALANYLNAGTTWSSGIPSWISDANLGVTTTIVGATFRTNWKTYYDARTALLNAIAAKAKTLADNAQTTANVGSAHAGTAHAPSNADHTQTTINGGLVTTGTVQVVQGGTVAAGITGNTAGDTAVRFWAGATFANRASASFRVLQSGALFATNATITGTITCGSGSQIAGFTATATDLTAGTGSTAITISADTTKAALFAGSSYASNAPLALFHDGTARIGGFSFDANSGLSQFANTAFTNKLMVVRPPDSDAINDPLITLQYKYNNVTQSTVYLTTSVGSTKEYAPITTTVPTSGNFGFYTNGKIHADGGFFPVSDERAKSDITDVSVLGPLKSLRVKKYRIDDVKMKRLAREKSIATSLRDKNAAAIEPIAEELGLPNYDSSLSIGVMAADFNAAFGVCRNDKETYNLSDAIGVALRAIQELAEIVDDQATEIAELRAVLKLPEKPQKAKEELVEATQEELELIYLLEKNIDERIEVIRKALNEKQVIEGVKH